MKSLNVKDLIKQIEVHTGMPFDASNKRHLLHLQSKIESFYENELRILNLVRRHYKAKVTKMHFTIQLSFTPKKDIITKKLHNGTTY